MLVFLIQVIMATGGVIFLTMGIVELVEVYKRHRGFKK